MNELKYIIVTPQSFNKPMGARAILFNGMMVHADMVPPRCKVESAGFCHLFFGDGTLKVICKGDSESLELESDPLFDSIIITRTLTQQHPLLLYLDL